MKLGLLTILAAFAVAVPWAAMTACTPDQLHKAEAVAQAIDVKAIAPTQLVCDLAEPIAAATPAKGFVDFACLVLEEAEAWLAQLDAGAAPPSAPIASVRALVVHVPADQAQAFYADHYPGSAVLRALLAGDGGTFTVPAPVPALFPPPPPPPPPPASKGDASP